MVLEHVPLTIDPDRAEAFEAAFAEAVGLIESTEGCRTASLHRCVEKPSRYLLLVEWDTLEAHTVGFRESERFTQWRELVGPFFTSAPEVLHFEPVD